MFNKKLKERIQSLEDELGYVYANDYHQDLKNGMLSRIQERLTKLEGNKK